MQEVTCNHMHVGMRHSVDVHDDAVRSAAHHRRRAPRHRVDPAAPFGTPTGPAAVDAAGVPGRVTDVPPVGVIQADADATCERVGVAAPAAGVPSLRIPSP